MRWTEISSGQNPLIKKIQSMKTSAGARKSGCFLIEGVRAVDELMAAPDFVIEAVFADGEFFAGNRGYIRALQQGLPESVPGYVVSRAMFARLAETQTPQGILALVQRKTYTVDAVLARGREPFLCLLENLRDPGNAGTILRTADSAGADGILCTKGTVDFYSGKVVRSAMGSLLHLPVARMDSLAETAAKLRASGVRLVAAALDGEKFHYEEDLTGPVAILIGNEGAGLSEDALALADTAVKIPMRGRAESLNAAVAAGILMYEVVRQRAEVAYGNTD